MEAAKAERKSDGDGEYEAGKKTPMRRLRGNVEHSDAERQNRMKETDGDPDDKEGEEARKGDIKREGQSESEECKSESNGQKKNLLYERYLEWKRRNEEKEEEERRRYPDKVNDPEAYQAMLFRQSWDKCYLKNYGSFDKKTTIEVRVTCGTWPADGFRCIFVANAGIGERIVLLETADDRVPPLTGDKISLARQVVSVDCDRELKVVATITNGSATYTDEKGFEPLKMGASSKELSIGGLGLEVTVYWSCFPFAPV